MQTTPSWVAKSSNFPNASTYPNVLDAKGENVVWGFGADGTAAAAADYRVFTKTGDGGNTWTGGTMTGVPTTVSISDIAAGDGNTAWVIAFPNTGTGGVWKTTNGGANWTKQTKALFNSATSFPNTIHFWDLNTGVAAGDPINGKLEVYTTTNGGTTWTAVSGATAAAGEYAYVHNEAVAGNSIWYGSNQGRIFRSNDKGATWLETLGTPLSDFGGEGEFGYIALKDASTAWIVSSFGILYKTADAGVNFEPVDIQTGTLYPTSIAYVPTTDQTLLCGGASTTYGRGSSISFDGGSNWIEINNSNTDIGITSIAATSTTAIYGGSFSSAGQGVNKLTPISLATSEAGAVKGISIAPNPTYGDLNISTVLNVKAVEILDMNGRLIKTFGADSKKLDLSSLKVGVYAVKVTTVDGKSQITKFIKK